MPVLKLEKDDENREIEFELCYLKSLNIKERFLLMQKKSDEIKKMLRKLRVNAPVARRTPHRSGREGLPHPVPRFLSF